MSDSRDSGDEGDYSYDADSDFHRSNDHLGVLRFPTAMSYHSDAQRSDAATVCSGSILEDIEVESVISAQDDAPLHASSDPVTENTDTSARAHPVGKMNPPLHRPSMVPQTASIPAHSITTDDVGIHNAYSPDQQVQTEFNQADSETKAKSLNSDNVSETLDAVFYGYNDGKVPAAPSSVRSFGSNVGSDDCGGSLDVETHSVGTRSIHSQDDAQPTHLTLVETEHETTAVASLSIAPVEDGGRRSPGGTIYKGRGIRRYQGRYMHLPLQRFHQNPVNLDEYDHTDDLLDHSSHHQDDIDDGDEYMHPDWDYRRHDNSSLHRDDNPPVHHPKSRSRSRSRSPPQKS